MATAKPKLLFLITLFALMSFDRALSQETPIGTLTIPEITQQPVPVLSAGMGYGTRSPASPGGGAQGPAIFTEFAMTKLVDATSPTLLVSAASSRVFPAARIELYASDGTTVLAIYELSNIVVSSAHMGGSAVGRLTETVSLDYQRIRMTVMTPAGPVTACWDQTQNVAC